MSSNIDFRIIPQEKQKQQVTTTAKTKITHWNAKDFEGLIDLWDKASYQNTGNNNVSKNSLIFNQSTTEFCALFNTINPGPVTTHNTGYNLLVAPCLSRYVQQTPIRGLIRLSNEALKEAPKELIDSLGADLQGKNVDIFLTYLDGRNLLARDTRDHYSIINLCLHSWLYPDLQKNQERKEYPRAGIFPVYACEAQGNQGDDVCVGGLKHQEVYAHPNGHLMLFSPDNMQFLTDKNYPFSIFWTAAQHGDRVLISKIVCITQRGQSYFNSDKEKSCINTIRNATTNCPNLEEFLVRMERGVREELQEKLDPIVQAYEKNSHKGDELFEKLEPWHQHGCYKQAWIIQGQPMDGGPEFGNMSFNNLPKLNTKFHCTNAQKAECLRNHIQEVLEILVVSQKRLVSTQYKKLDLLPPPKQLSEAEKIIQRDRAQIQNLRGDPDNIMNIMYADVWEKYLDNKPDEATAFFECLDASHVDAWYTHAWEIHGKPMKIHPNFGKVSFENDHELDKKYHCTVEQKLACIRKRGHEIITVQQPIAPQIQLEAPKHETPVYFTAAKVALATKDIEPIKLILNGSQENVNKIFGAIWKMKGCPQKHDFGSTYYKNEASDIERAQAVLMTMPQ